MYLYVAASKRVVGCAMIQAVSSAHRVVPEDDARTCTAGSAACSQMPCATPAEHSADARIEPPSDPATQSSHEQCSVGGASLPVKENRTSLGSEAGPSSSHPAEAAAEGLVAGRTGSLGCIRVSRESSLGLISARGAASAASRAGVPSKQPRVGVGLQPQQHQALLRLDESRAQETACGVRVIWVSVEARLQGIASKLLDVARCASTTSEHCSLVVKQAAMLAFTMKHFCELQTRGI